MHTGGIDQQTVITAGLHQIRSAIAAQLQRQGGVGAGLYGMLVMVVLTVFIAGLMVGRTPEYLGKKIGAREIKLASLAALRKALTLLVTAYRSDCSFGAKTLFWLIGGKDEPDDN